MKRIVLQTDQNHPAIKAYKEAIERGRHGQHVIPKDGLWAVKEIGSSKATRIFSTQSEAVELARSKATSLGSSVFIHGTDGLIRERQDF